MNKQALLQETYDSAFKDELEKFAAKGYDVASKLVRNFGVPVKKSMDAKKKGVSAIIRNISKFKKLDKSK